MKKLSENIKRRLESLKIVLGILKSLDDTYPPDAIIDADELLGPDSPVRFWVLVKHLLEDYYLLKGYLDRLCRLYGQNCEVWPGGQIGMTLKRCEEFIREICQAPVIDRIIESYQEPVGRATGNNPDEVFDVLIYRHIRREVLTGLNGLKGETWKADVTSDDGTLGDWIPREWNDKQQTDLTYFVGNYCRTYCLYPWQYNDESNDNVLINYLKKNGRTFMKDRLNWDSLMPGAYELLHGIDVFLYEEGYDELFTILTDPDYRGGHSSLTGRVGEAINIIPGQAGDKCCPTLLALSKGGKKGKYGFDTIMKQVKLHLIKCSGITNQVIFICNFWDSKTFKSEHIDEIRAYEKYKEIKFLFLMVGSDGRSISQVNI